ncbi:MAG: hypothetical protein WC910_08755 [Bacteroidales bacterium]
MKSCQMTRVLVMLLKKANEDKIKLFGVELKKVFFKDNDVIALDTIRYQELLGVFARQLSVSVEALNRTLNDLHTEELDLNVVLNKYRNCLYNLDFLSEGMPVPAWTGEPIETHIYCRYVSFVAANPVKHQRAGVAVNFFCMDGLLAGVAMTTILPASFIQVILRKYAGLPRHTEINFKELVGCLLKTKLAKVGGKVRITSLSVDTAVRTNNKKLYKDRRDIHRCNTPGISCAICRKTRKECRLSCQ